MLIIGLFTTPSNTKTYTVRTGKLDLQMYMIVLHAHQGQQIT